MIEDLGHTPIQAESAMQALAALASGIDVDVVITAHAIPVMTGLQLTLAIKERYSQLPVILATGYAELPAESAVLGLHKLLKPCSQLDLALAIHAALGRDQDNEVLAAAGGERR